MSGDKRGNPDDRPDDGGLRWDLSTILLVAAVVAALLFLTWEMWAPHPYPE